mmetsp:Transcript_12895/g.33473  ORF Transcript_12895/g.33473 Transcript_12895/m.33473 type:complete len:223 (-) Transcript_12895:323-991(-)
MAARLQRGSPRLLGAAQSASWSSARPRCSTATFARAATSRWSGRPRAPLAPPGVPPEALEPGAATRQAVTSWARPPSPLASPGSAWCRCWASTSASCGSCPLTFRGRFSPLRSRVRTSPHWRTSCRRRRSPRRRSAPAARPPSTPPPPVAAAPPPPRRSAPGPRTSRPGAGCSGPGCRTACSSKNSTLRGRPRLQRCLSGFGMDFFFGTPMRPQRPRRRMHR